MNVAAPVLEQSLLSCPPYYRKKARRESEETFSTKGGGLLSSEMEGLGGLSYRPRTKETKATYEMILSFVQQMIGDQVA